VNKDAVRSSFFFWPVTRALCLSCRFQCDLGRMCTSQDGNVGSPETISVCLLQGYGGWAGCEAFEKHLPVVPRNNAKERRHTPDACSFAISQRSYSQDEKQLVGKSVAGVGTRTSDSMVLSLSHCRTLQIMWHITPFEAFRPYKSD
jgi:hypothetical protein